MIFTRDQLYDQSSSGWRYRASFVYKLASYFVEKIKNEAYLMYFQNNLPPILELLQELKMYGREVWS